MKKAVDDLDIWYRQHIQRSRKYSAPILPMGTQRVCEQLPCWDRKDEKVQHLTVPERDGTLIVSSTRTPSPTRKDRGRKSLPDGKLCVPSHAEPLRRKSYDLAADGGKSKLLGHLLNRLNLPAMKKTEAARAAAGTAGGTSSTPSAITTSGATANVASSTKPFKKASSKSPSLPRKPGSTVGIENASMGGVGDSISSSGLASCSLVAATANLNRAYAGSGTLHPPISGDDSSSVTVSVDDSETADGSSGRENGGSETVISGEDVFDGQVVEGDAPDSHKVRLALEHLRAKIYKTKELIKKEQTQKESNVNEYLQLAAGAADKQQNQRIKTLFEKRNQKSAQSINHLQKKLEQYQRRLQEIETHGVTGHKQAKEVLRDMGQGLKDVGANIFDGLSGFSGGVVDNIKGARDTIVSKPREFAHLIKNRFGSADNISQMKMEESAVETEAPRQGERTGSTLPANFKYTSDEDNSSATSGSGYGALHSSPHSASQNASQSLPIVTQAMLEPLQEDLSKVKANSQKTDETLCRILEEFESYKSMTQSELGMVRSLLEEEKFKVERLEEQINDLTELHQNEMANLKQDMSSMEEKIEYRLDERTTDLSDLVDNCQTRIHRLEQQQQQQQVLSMEMVENVTFRTILTKLINVVLAILAVVLVLVSTAAHLFSPFLNTRMRILSTSALVLIMALFWNFGPTLAGTFVYIWDTVLSILPGR